MTIRPHLDHGPRVSKRAFGSTPRSSASSSSAANRSRRTMPRSPSSGTRSGARIELTCWEGKERIEPGEQLDHLAFEVPDLDRFLARAREQHVRVAKEPYSLKGGLFPDRVRPRPRRRVDRAARANASEGIVRSMCIGPTEGEGRSRPRVLRAVFGATFLVRFAFGLTLSVFASYIAGASVGFGTESVGTIGLIAAFAPIGEFSTVLLTGNLADRRGRIPGAARPRSPRPPCSCSSSRSRANPFWLGALNFLFGVTSGAILTASLALVGDESGTDERGLRDGPVRRDEPARMGARLRPWVRAAGRRREPLARSPLPPRRRRAGGRVRVRVRARCGGCPKRSVAIEARASPT